MDTVEEAERCIKYLNNSVMEGRNITVEKVIASTFTRVVDTNSETTYVLRVDLEVFFGYYSEDTVQAMCSNQDSEFINFNFSKYSSISGQPKELLCTTRFTTTKRSNFSTKPECSPSTNQWALPTH